MAGSVLGPKGKMTPDLRAALAAVAVGTVLAVLILYTAHASLPPSAVELPFAGKPIFRSVLPQGWGFFTRSPREAFPVAYRVGPSGQWEEAALGARSNYLGGFGRRSRVQNIEMGLLLNASGAEWQPCDGEVSACLHAIGAMAIVANPSPSPILCGDIGFVMREPIPWAWYRSAETVQMPTKTLRLNVTC